MMAASGAGVVFKPSQATYPLVMTLGHTGPFRHSWRLAIGPFDATGNTRTNRGAQRQLRRHAELFALISTTRDAWKVP